MKIQEQRQIPLEDFTKEEEIPLNSSNPKPDLNDNEDFSCSKQ